VIEPLATIPAFFIGVAFVLGLVVGSFLNVVSHRLPRMMERDWKLQCAELCETNLAEAPSYNLVTPGSSCPHCGHRIAWYENIPVFSFLLLRGRCSACRAPIAWRYPVLELACGLLTAYAAWHFGWGMEAVAAWVLLWFLLALTAIDLETQLLPDALTLPLLWLGLLINLDATFATLEAAVIGAVAGYLSLWTVYQLFRLLTGKEGMGFGDFKLLAALGAWFGWTLLPAIVLAASLVGAVVGITMILAAGHDRARPIPFGPYLAMGGVIALFWGQDLASLYFGA